MSINADNLKKNELVSLYLNKASGGKYVVEVRAAFVGIKSEDFIYLLEACKKVNLARLQDKDLIDRSNGWQRGFEGSQPVLKLKEQLTKVGQILEGLNIPIGKKYSWGAFVQAHEAKIIPLMESLWFVRPMAQSFHYTRAAFMVMSCDQAYKYGKARFDACIATVRIVIANTDMKELMAALAADKKSKEVAIVIYNANKKKKFIPTLAETEEFSSKPLGSMGSTEIENMVAAYPVDFRMYLQNRDFRRNQYKASDMEKAKDFIAPVFALFQASDEIKDKVLMLQDKDAEWRKRYFELFKNIKAVARSVRRVMAGEMGMNAQNAVRDYSSYSIKM